MNDFRSSGIELHQFGLDLARKEYGAGADFLGMREHSPAVGVAAAGDVVLADVADEQHRPWR